MLFTTLALGSIAVLCNAQSTFSPLRPPALPLAVKSPYMSTWQQAGSDNGNGGYLAGEWPTFWQGQTTGWTGLIRVDNLTYTWMGAPSQNQVYVKQTAYDYTSTRSIFTMNVNDQVQMKITFLSVIAPDELLRMSLPYSYMDVEVQSMDGDEHSVQIYTDITSEWVAGDTTADAQWSFGVIEEHYQPNSPAPTASPTAPASGSPTTYGTKQAPPWSGNGGWPHTEQPTYAPGQGHKPTQFSWPHPPQHTGHWGPPHNPHQQGGIAYHKVWRQQQLEFAEFDQQAEWGYWYYATENTNELTYQSGSNTTIRAQFINDGYLADTQDTDYRPIDDNTPTFGFAVNYGKVSSSAVSSLFQLSLHQQNCVQFEGASGNETVPCLWTSYFSSDLAALEYFYNDYSEGSSIATSLDNQVASDSSAAGGSDYVAITSLAVRQAFGALEYTHSPEVPYVFLKEISSDGNIQTVDVIFPFHPIAIYLNATILKYMLDPLFINQEAGYWPYQFSIHDLGDSFPNATGHNNGVDEMQPLEECGNMLIMTLAYAQRANDDAYLAQHYNILKQWNNYLVNDSLIPMNQISTDDFAGALANQTNLAIKGIIGIEAMAQIANRTGHVEDGRNFTNISHAYVSEWMNLAIADTSTNFTKPHTTLAYGMNDTYSLLYNLFGDRELGLDLVPQSVYDMESAFYPEVFQKYGVPLDTRHTWTKTDWQIFCASIASASTKAEFISTIFNWINVTPTNFAFTDLYDAVNGNYPSTITFIARPVIGGVFALLALESAPSNGYVQPS